MRVQLQFIFESQLSPVIYAHEVEDVPAVLCRLRDQMEPVCGRGDELSFVAARCVQQLLGDDDGATGVRITNASQELTLKNLVHGDSMYVVEIGDRWRVRQLTGYEDVATFPDHSKESADATADIPLP